MKLLYCNIVNTTLPNSNCRGKLKFTEDCTDRIAFGELRTLAIKKIELYSLVEECHVRVHAGIVFIDGLLFLCFILQ